MPDELIATTDAPKDDTEGPLGKEPMFPTDEKKSTDNDDSAEAMARKAEIKRWQEKIKIAKERWGDAFERMRDNMDFVTGLQWPRQKNIQSTARYVCNFTLRAVNQGVAMLYARNPRVSAKPRDRMWYKIWDGRMETIMQANALVNVANQAAAMGQQLPLPNEIPMLLQDYQQGSLAKHVVAKVGETLEKVVQYQMDSLRPRFKLQMKQLVRRVRVCGVGYIKTSFCRDYETEITQSETRDSTMDRAKAARNILQRLEKGELEETSAEVAQLRQLVTSMGAAPLDNTNVSVKERIVFDFPPATSIIPDPNTRCLKGWVGTHWLAEEIYLPLQTVNAMFEKDIKTSGEIKLYGLDNKVDENKATPMGNDQERNKKNLCLWRIMDLDSKSEFIIADGYNDYVLEPDLITPAVSGFWQISAVTFNDVEVENGCQATVFPPSDVDLIFSAQKEWNSIRDRLSRHRKANGPKYIYPDGNVEPADLERVADAEDQDFVKVKGMPPGTDMSKIVTPFPVVPVQKDLYDSEPLREDTLLATGQQEANIGPAQPNVTATVGTIAEQSRMSVAASDVDGLDDSLSEVVQCAGELCLLEMSKDTVERIVGIGAVWPEQNQQDFLNGIDLEVIAASSGRPNKAIEVANWERLGPLLIQAGANPQSIVRETVKRLDDNLDPADFFALPVPAMPITPSQQTGPPATGASGSSPTRRSSAAKPKQPLQPTPTGVAVPLAGA